MLQAQAMAVVAQRLRAPAALDALGFGERRKYREVQLHSAKRYCFADAGWGGLHCLTGRSHAQETIVGAQHGE